MKSKKLVKKNKGLALQNLFFCLPIFAGVLCFNRTNVALCQVFPHGALNLVSYRQKCFSWHHNLPFLRGLEFVANTIWIFIKGLILSAKNFPLVKENQTEKNIFQFFIYFLFIFILFLIILFFAWIILGLLPPVVVLGVFGTFGSVFAQKFATAVVRCIFLYAFLGALQCFASVRAMWRFNTSANFAVAQKRFYALNFFNVLFGALLLDCFVVSLLCFDGAVGLQILVYLLCLAISFGLVFEVCLWQENKGGIYQKLCAIVAVLSFQPFGKTCLQVAQGAVMECELMKNNPKREDALPAKNNLAFVLSDVRGALQKAGIDDFAEAEWLVANVLGCGKLDLRFVQTLTDAQVRDVQNALERRLKSEPLEKIFGFTEFYGLRFKVNKSVLTPRPETELLVENVLKEVKGKACKVLDLCTGSGAIAVSVAKNCDAEVFAVDISEQALAVAKRNAEINEVAVKFRQSDLFSAVKKKFDVIVSNPPYIKTDDIPLLAPEVKNFDPTIALDGGNDGLYFYRRIASDAPRFLKSGGKLFLEIGIRQGAKVKKILTDNFQDIRILKDYNGIQRIVVATKKG